MTYADIQKALESLRPPDAEYMIVAVGVHGPNTDCYHGNAVVTIQSGKDTATSEALHLNDAIALAWGKIVEGRKQKKEKP